MTIVEGLVGQARILAPEKQSRRGARAFSGRFKHQGRGLAGCKPLPASAAFTGGRPQDETAIGQRRRQVGVEFNRIDNGPGMVGDTFHPVSVPGGRFDQAQAFKTKITHYPDNRSHVYDILGLEKNYYDIIQGCR